MAMKTKKGDCCRKIVLTVAGSDCSGGAGIQADLKTITAHRQYGMSVITALTAQNTTGVYGIECVPPAFVQQQMDCIFNDIRPDAVKIGMMPDADVIEAVAEKLKEYHAEQVVLDPVMVSTSGSCLLPREAVYALKTRLTPLAALITPNLPEAEALSGIAITDVQAMRYAAAKIHGETGAAVLIKGGHFAHTADDLLYTHDRSVWFHAPHIHNPNTHGTGCTLSSAIACRLAEGRALAESIALAKAYVTGALKTHFDVGYGSGPLDHMYRMR